MTTQPDQDSLFDFDQNVADAATRIVEPQPDTLSPEDLADPHAQWKAEHGVSEHGDNPWNRRAGSVAIAAAQAANPPSKTGPDKGRDLLQDKFGMTNPIKRPK